MTLNGKKARLVGDARVVWYEYRDELRRKIVKGVITRKQADKMLEELANKLVA